MCSEKWTGEAVVSDQSSVISDRTGKWDGMEGKLAVRSFRDLVVWQKALDLAVRIYGMTRSFPREEIYGLTSQIRRAAISVPSNIAEGQGRLTSGEFRQFLGIAEGRTSSCRLNLKLRAHSGWEKPR